MEKGSLKQWNIPERSHTREDNHELGVSLGLHDGILSQKGEKKIQGKEAVG